MLRCAREYGEIGVSDGANASGSRRRMRNPGPLLLAWPVTRQLWGEICPREPKKNYWPR